MCVTIPPPQAYRPARKFHLDKEDPRPDVCWPQTFQSLQTFRSVHSLAAGVSTGWRGTASGIQLQVWKLTGSNVNIASQYLSFFFYANKSIFMKSLEKIIKLFQGVTSYCFFILSLSFVNQRCARHILI